MRILLVTVSLLPLMAFRRQTAVGCVAARSVTTLAWGLQGQGCRARLPSGLQQREKSKGSHETELTTPKKPACGLLTRANGLSREPKPETVGKSSLCVF